MCRNKKSRIAGCGIWKLHNQSGLDAEAHVEAEEEAVNGDAAIDFSEERFVRGFFDGIAGIDTDLETAGNQADAAAKLSAELREAFFLVDMIIAVIKRHECA